MKNKGALWIGLAVLVLVQLACGMPNSAAKSTPTLPPAATEVEAAPTEPAAEPTQANEPAQSSCDPQPTDNAVSSGLISKVTMAKDTQGDQRDPVGPTKVFTPNAIIHAVTAIQDAPADTKFTAVWYAVNVGSAADCNTKIDTNDLTTDGSRNIDFSLSPTKSWPSGTYRVEIFVNDQLDQFVAFSVK